jgi:hypothetical protein
MRFVKDRGDPSNRAGLSDQPLDIANFAKATLAQSVVPHAQRQHVLGEEWSIGRTIVVHQMGGRCIPRKTCSSD